MRMLFHGDGRRIEYFVYKAGPGRPSLRLVPGPCPMVRFPKQVGVLPCGGAGEHYSVAFPVTRSKPRMVHEIHVFSSESESWSTKIARISDDPETTYHEVVLHDPSKAVAAGGSSLAWVDLWRGILLCEDVLDEDPELRLIQWPLPPPDEDLIDLYAAQSVRDATLIDGVITFVASKYDAFSSSRYCHVDKRWKATVWKREMSSDNWEFSFKVDIANILSTNSPPNSSLLQKLWDDELNKLDLNKVLSAAPTLSLNSEDVVYFMANLVSNEALLLAVNARAGRLEGFQQAYFLTNFSASAFSRFFDASSGGGVSIQSEDIMRENLEPSEFRDTLLAAQDQLLQLAECVHNGPSYHECRSLLCTGPVACLYGNCQEPAQYANGNILCEAASKAAAAYIRAVEDIDILAAYSDLQTQDEIIDNINVALEALDILLHAVLENMEGERATQHDTSNWVGAALKDFITLLGKEKGLFY
ncbi:hypothetical protein ACP70R_030928 [Stipagrostis hirtigluma subsp. patula]